MLRIADFGTGVRYLTLIFVGVAGGVGCGGRTTADAGTVDIPALPRDTATLDSAAARLAGFALARADSAPWREQWTVPARLVLDPAGTQRLGAIVEGRVARVLVNVGDPVRAGQVLVAVHSHEMLDAQSALAKAKAGDAQTAAALGLAEHGAARAERLYALKALALADLERARAALAEARGLRDVAGAELERATALRDHLVGSGPVPEGTDEHEVLVRSPIDGVVIARDAQPGTVVLVGAPLVTVSRGTSLMLSVNVPERALPAVAAGGDLSFTVGALPGEQFTARVMHVAPTLDSTTRTVELQARVLGNPASLRAEMYATAELLGPSGPMALVVPADAVQALDGDTVVVAALPWGTGMLLEATPVRVGRRTAQRVEILAGLLPGTPVVARGAAVAKAELLRRRER